MDAFTYERTGRSVSGVVIVGAIWILLAALWLWLEAAWWIVLMVWLLTLPALADVVRNPHSGLALTAQRIRWHTGARDGRVAFSEIDHVRLDTRLDLSVRASLVLRSGTRVRLPYECTPPHQAFEQAMIARGLKVQRHHFQLFQ